MMSPTPSTEKATAAKRPRYLVVALVGALVFGAGCWTEGCKQLAFYRGERDRHVALNAAVHDDAERQHVERLYQHFVDVADLGRNKGVPLAAGTFVLGAALLALAARGLGRKANTRSALMQVVGAQAIVVALTYFVMKDTRNAELDWEFERRLVHERETTPPEQYQAMVPGVRMVRHWAPGTWLGFRSLASILILLALSRPRARAFFEAATKAPPVSE